MFENPVRQVSNVNEVDLEQDLGGTGSDPGRSSCQRRAVEGSYVAAKKRGSSEHLQDRRANS